MIVKSLFQFQESPNTAPQRGIPCGHDVSDVHSTLPFGRAPRAPWHRTVLGSAAACAFSDSLCCSARFRQSGVISSRPPALIRVLRNTPQNCRPYPYQGASRGRRAGHSASLWAADW